MRVHPGTYEDVIDILYDKFNFIDAWPDDEVKNLIVDMKMPPPLAASTVRRKGHDYPQVDSDTIVTFIKHRVTPGISSTKIL